MNTRIIRYFALPSLLLALGTLFVAPATAAIIAPGIPGTLPRVGPETGNPYSAVRASVSGVVSALEAVPGAIPDVDSFEETVIDHDDDLTVAAVSIKGASAQSGSLVVSSTAITRAGFGKLQAQAIASHSGGGLAEARSAATVDFIDVITIDGIDESPTLDAKARIHGAFTTGLGSAQMRFQMWIFPFGQLPPTGGGNFFATSYYSETRQKGVPTVIDARGSGENGAIGFVDGASYWIYGRLDVAAADGATKPADWQFGSTTDANFYDTVTLSLTPNPSTPSATFTSHSGFTYPVVVPEPSAGLMALSSAVGLGVLRRRK